MRSRLLVLLALLAPLGLIASQVGPITSFSNGTVADATVVNANFTALVTAIDDNDARLDDLAGGNLQFRAKNSAGAPGTCDANAKGGVYFDTTANAFFGCDGTAWTKLYRHPPNSATAPAASCRALKAADPAATDGAYWIDPTPGTPGDAVEVWCDMSFDGGGWTTIVNTLRPNIENALVVTTPVADMKVLNPTTRNVAIWKWAGEPWTEFLVECRTSATATPARWQFARYMQSASIQTAFNDLIVNGNNAPSAFGTTGTGVCYTKNASSIYCGHNNAGGETTWGDGLQLGNANPVWTGLYFGATDAQGHFKCSQTTATGYTSTTGDVGPGAIWTYRFR